jgi:predicted 3-demethylubiquinone-9 3-methyltransferase (glyoxalase superfamily)
MDKQLTTCIWYNHTAEEAADFYVSLFPDGRITSVQRTPVDTPSQGAGEVIVVEFELMGQKFIGLNGGPQFPQTEAVSFTIHTDSQEETDKFWDAIVGNGGKESQCGWCKDKWGVNWQVTPNKLIELGLANPDAAAGKRVMEAMFGMKKIDIAAIEAAAAGK